MRLEGHSRCHCEFQTLSVSTQALSVGVGALEAPGHIVLVTSIHRVRAGCRKAAIRLTPPWRQCPAPGDPAMSAAARGRLPFICSPTWLASALLAAWLHSPSIKVGPGGEGSCTWLLPA